MENGMLVKVAINDRGPYVEGRVIDLSSAAAHSLGMQEKGIVNVKVEAFKTDQVRDLKPVG
jgi:rare lipoprotein A